MKQKLRVFLTLLLCAVASVGWGETGTIEFGTNKVKINATVVKAKDNLDNTWDLGTTGTTSFTQNADYSQIGSSSKPAKTITFTTTLPNDVTITSLSAKFGGFSGTAGTVTLSVDNVTVGTGNLNGTEDVIVSSSSEATGKVLKVAVTNIAKGVKCYYVSYTYTSSGGTSKCATPIFNPEAGTYTGTQPVSISTTTEGATIHYTLDGTDPTTNSTTYSAAINVSTTTTIKAMAVKEGMDNSNVASATYTIVQPLTTMDEIFAAATEAGSSAAPVVITFNNWVVTGVKNSNAYVTDGTKGFIIYQSNHGFKVGDVLSGTASCKVQLYNGSAEITVLSSTTTGLTVTTGGTITPVTTMTIANLGGVNTGAVFKFENLVYDGTDLSDGTNAIKPYTTLYSGTFENGKTYNVTGVYLQYNTTKEILPRSENDIEEVTLTTPTVLVSSNSLTGLTYVAENGPSVAKTISVSGENLTEAIALALDEDSNFEMSLTEGSDYANNLTLSPEDGSVANTTVYVRLKDGLETGEYTGTITLSSTGAANVTVNLSGNVTAPEAQNVTWDLSIDETATATDSEMTWTSDYATMGVYKGSASTNTNNYYPGTSGQSYTSTRFYKNSNLTITPASGYKITSVVFTATTESYANAFNSSTWTNATTEASGTTVTITPTIGAVAISATIGGTCGFTSVKVFYEDDSSPAISVEPSSIDATCEETSGTLTVTYANVDNSTALIFFCNANGEAATYDWIGAHIDDDKNIVYNIDANTNTDEARTAYLKVKVGDVYSNLVTITQAKFVIDYATLPFSYDGNGSGTLPVGLTQHGLGTYGSSPAMKFDAEGDYLVLKINEAPKALYFDIQGKGNGTWAGTFTVQTSSDGESYTDLKVYTSLTGDVETEMFTDIASNIRYIKWIFTSKETGFNVALGKIIATNVAPEAIEVSINSSATGADGAFYSSVYYSNKTLQVPEGVECLTYKVVDGALTVSKTYNADDVIPADEAVVIKASASGTVTFTVAPTTNVKDTESMLLGVDDATSISEPGYKYYKLTLNAAKEEGTAGFYFDKGVTDGSTINAAANKCYLRVPVDQTNGAKGFVFGEETDGIGQIEMGQTSNAAIYNLNGQKVNKAQKGIYIVNGKKVVIK